MLPNQMYEIVLKDLWVVYTNKMKLLQNESLHLFTHMMQIASFRRCIFEEVVGAEG